MNLRSLAKPNNHSVLSIAVEDWVLARSSSEIRIAQKSYKETAWELIRHIIAAFLDTSISFDYV